MVDKESIEKIVGSLYINNVLLSQKLAEAEDQIRQLRQLLETYQQ